MDTTRGSTAIASGTGTTDVAARGDGTDAWRDVGGDGTRGDTASGASQISTLTPVVASDVPGWRASSYVPAAAGADAAAVSPGNARGGIDSTLLAAVTARAVAATDAGSVSGGGTSGATGSTGAAAGTGAGAGSTAGSGGLTGSTSSAGSTGSTGATSSTGSSGSSSSAGSSSSSGSTGSTGGSTSSGGGGTSGSGSGSGSGSAGTGTGTGTSDGTTVSGITPLAPGWIDPERVSLSVKTGALGLSSLDSEQLRRAQLDTDLTLKTLGDCGALGCLQRGTLKVADAGADQWVSWGRWTDGEAVLVTGDHRRNVAIGANQGLHYLLGTPTPTMPTSGAFSYALTGATAATLSDGSQAPGRMQAIASVQFAPGMATKVGLEGTLTFANGTMSFCTDGGAATPGQSQLRMTTASTFSGTIAAAPDNWSVMTCGGQLCDMRVRGGFFGPAAARMGIDYSIADRGTDRTIGGTAVFSKR